MKLMLKAPGTKCLKLKYDELLLSFAFNFNSCCYITAVMCGRGLHPPTSQLHLSRFNRFVGEPFCVDFMTHLSTEGTQHIPQKVRTLS